MKNIHLIGIGGDGMSGLAKVLFEQGFCVTGSNIEENKRICELRELGIPIHLNHSPENLNGTDTVIFSSAINGENEELKAAQSHGHLVLHRIEMLAKIFEGRFSIGIAGTHGKTTTAAMIATLLKCAGKDPTFLIGAPCPTLKSNAALGKSEYLVAEVDESDGHFLKLVPNLAVITNIGRDHLNFYRDEAHIIENFKAFIWQSERAILCADDPNSLKAIEQEQQEGRKSPQISTFSIEAEADLMARRIKQQGLRTSFELLFRGKKKATVQLWAPGRHNVYNALAAILAGLHAGLSFPQMAHILKDFSLPERRFQVLKEAPLWLIDDYAHLPEQIEANLRTIHEAWEKKRVIAVFQPHRFTRTQHINGEFSDAFDLADLIVVTEIYPAFEQPIAGIDARLIVEAIKKHKPNVYYVPQKAEIFKLLQQTVHAGDFVIGFGAGDIWKVLHQFAASI